MILLWFWQFAFHNVTKSLFCKVVTLRKPTGRNGHIKEAESLDITGFMGCLGVVEAFNRSKTQNIKKKKMIFVKFTLKN